VHLIVVFAWEETVCNAQIKQHAYHYQTLGQALETPLFLVDRYGTEISVNGKILIPLTEMENTMINTTEKIFHNLNHTDSTAQ